MNDDYSDIINLPHPSSKNHTPMPMINRAAQFAPFAALSGHDDAIAETARWTDSQFELDDAANEMLNRKLRDILSRLEDKPEVKITYFIPDSKKAGGYYVPVVGVIKKLDEYEQCLVLTDGLKIPIAAISELSD